MTGTNGTHTPNPSSAQEPGFVFFGGLPVREAALFLWGDWLLQRRWGPQVAAAAGGAAAAAFRGGGGDQGCLAQGGGGGVEPFPICLDQGGEP